MFLQHYSCSVDILCFVVLVCIVRRFLFSSRRRHTRCALVTGVQTCALPILGLIFMRLPGGFLPEEDQGTMFALVQAPPGGTLPRTQKALDVVRDHFLKVEKAAVDSVFTVSGFSFNGQGQNAGLAFIKLKDWKDRSSSENKAQALGGDRKTTRLNSSH